MPNSFSPSDLDARGFPAPTQGFIVTHLLIVGNQDRSREFYSRVLGGEVIRERDPAVVRLNNSWIVINSGGAPPMTSRTSLPRLRRTRMC